MEKEAQWKGYYNYYFSEAKRKGVNALEILDEQWSDGRTTAETCVLPYITETSTLLEIACGIGRVSRFVAPRCGNLYCTDILDEALAEAKKNLKHFRNVSLQKTNGYDLSGFSEEFFDCVYSFTAFSHFDFELVVNYFCEIKRILKPGGIGIIGFKKWVDEHDVNHLLDKMKERGGIKNYEAQVDKLRYVSKEMLKVLCNYYELTVVDDNPTKYTFRKESSSTGFSLSRRQTPNPI